MLVWALSGRLSHQLGSVVEDWWELQWVYGSWQSATITNITSGTHSKLVGIPCLVVGCIGNRVEGRDHATCGLHVVGAAAVSAGVSLEVLRVLRGLVGFAHLTPGRGGKRRSREGEGGGGGGVG